MQECIETCLDCRRACLETVDYCLGSGGRHATHEHIAVLLNGSQICQTAAYFLISHPVLYPRACGVCAEIGLVCVRECLEMRTQEQMRACADVGQRCARACLDRARKAAAA